MKFYIAIFFINFTNLYAQEKVIGERKLGLETLERITKNDGNKIVSSLKKNFPLLAQSIIHFAYGKVISRDVLTDQRNEISTVSMLAAQGGLDLQLKVHIEGALNVGVKPEELVEIIYLTKIYAGFPKAINAAKVMESVFKERKIKLKKEN